MLVLYHPEPLPKPIKTLRWFSDTIGATHIESLRLRVETDGDDYITWDAIFEIIHAVWPEVKILKLPSPYE
jgi:hypothetical protein